MKNITKEIAWLVSKWDAIPDKFKTNIQGSEYSRSTAVIEGVPLEEHTVILLLDRQKPSVQASYDFDEERIAVTRTGKVVWGFDSGCSCPSPWHDRYPGCYSCSKNWKEFVLNVEKFDHGALDECLAKINEIKIAVGEADISLIGASKQVLKLREEIKKGRKSLADFVIKREKEEQKLRTYIISREKKLHEMGETLN